MERELWKAVNGVLVTVDQVRKATNQDFGDGEIVQVYYWSVIWDRPVSWACLKTNWPSYLRRRSLPSSPTMSRRLRSRSVVALLNTLERRITAPSKSELFWMIDGKPLPIGGCSKDRQAGYGRAAGCMAKGYKMHALMGSKGGIAQWRIAPMNTDERVMARRILKTAPQEVVGYVTADGNYDSNKLHAVCDQRGNLQLVSPRRYGSKHGTGHRRQTPGRIRMIALIENPMSEFGRRLLCDRAEIERQFAHLTNWGGGLNGLPAWVRTHSRVRRWVQAKLVLKCLKRQTQSMTYVAA